MRDYDFLLSDVSKISHFSEHDSYLDKHYEIKAIIWQVDLWE
jgi:hypothetical protein